MDDFEAGGAIAGEGYKPSAVDRPDLRGLQGCREDHISHLKQLHWQRRISAGAQSLQGTCSKPPPSSSNALVIAGLMFRAAWQAQTETGVQRQLEILGPLLSYMLQGIINRIQLYRMCDAQALRGLWCWEVTVFGSLAFTSIHMSQ